jgi:hypothetical protein
MTVAVVHLVATTLMAGVILYVQAVHYPLMADVGRERFARYEARHTRRTGWVVVPLMLTELVTAGWLAAAPPEPGDRLVAWIGLMILAVIWVSTAALQVPAHRRLADGFDPAAHRRLVATNWIRTAGWAARVPIAVLLL